MTKSELIEQIENGSDIMFDVAKKHFTILTWTDDGIAIGEQFPNDGELQYYESAEDLVEGFMVNGRPLGSLVNDIVITQYT